MTQLEFNTSQEAWEKINEYFLLGEQDIVRQGGYCQGSLLVIQDLFVSIRTLWVDPKFNYGAMFNYRMQKWTSLVRNYVDLNYLDLVKAEVLRREKSHTSSYNISFIFDNLHAHGKGCLLHLTFSRRPSESNPIVIATLRSSEIVKRLNFDFLLIQRMAEYVYGKDIKVGAKLYFPNIYTSSETSAMYHGYKSIPKLYRKLKLNGGLQPFQQRVYDAFRKFSTIDQEKVTYKVHQRVAKALQNKATIPPLLAENLNLVDTI